MSRKSASPEVMAARAAVDASVSDLPAGACVLVACSGGPDSLALAGATAWVATHRGLKARGIVVDHGLQAASDEVAAHAVKVCGALGIDEAEVVEVRVGTDGGPEAAARTARYAALGEAARRYVASAVLLGHTRDDQAETVLLRLSRGSGARSLAAMRPRNELWRRPFLNLGRATVHQAAGDLLGPLGERAWVDPHNSDDAFARVRVRSLLDGLRDAVGPGVVLGLTRSAELLYDDAEALDAQAAAEFSRLVTADGGRLVVDCDQLLALPRALRTRLIRLMGLRSGCAADQFGYEHVTQVEALVVDWHGQGELRLPGFVTAGRTYDRLWLLAQS